MEKLTGGLINRVYHNSEKKSVIKQFSESKGITGLGVSKHHRYLRELFSLRRSDFEKILAPKLLSSDFLKSEIETNHISGTHLGNILESQNSINDIIIVQKIMTQLGITLKLIHKPIKYDIDKYTHKLVSKISEKIQKSKMILTFEKINPDLLLSKLENILKNDFKNSNCITLIHGDFWQNNVIIDNDKLAGIVDWEFSGIGNPYEDFAILSYRFQNYENELNLLFQSYEITPNIKILDVFLAFSILKVISCLSVKEYYSAKYYNLLNPLVKVLQVIAVRL